MKYASLIDRRTSSDSVTARVDAAITQRSAKAWESMPAKDRFTAKMAEWRTRTILQRKTLSTVGAKCRVAWVSVCPRQRPECLRTFYKLSCKPRGRSPAKCESGQAHLALRRGSQPYRPANPG